MRSPHLLSRFCTYSRLYETDGIE
jgi:nucleoside phosphorylase